MSQHRHWCRNVLLDIIQCSNCKDAVRIRWVGRLGGFKRIWHVYCRLGSCFLFIFIWRVVEKLISDYKESPHHWRSKEINMLRWVCCDGCQPSKQIVIEEFCCTCNSFTVGMAAESGGTDFRDSSHSTSARWFLLSSSFINLRSSYSSVSCKNHAKAVQRFCWIWWGDCLLFFFKEFVGVDGTGIFNHHNHRHYDLFWDRFRYKQTHLYKGLLGIFEWPGYTTLYCWNEFPYIQCRPGDPSGFWSQLAGAKSRSKALNSPTGAFWGVDSDDSIFDLMMVQILFTPWKM